MFLFFACFLAILYITLSSDIDGAAHHGHGDITGATTGAAGQCQTHSCHGGNNTSVAISLQVIDTSTMLPITTYKAFRTYLVTLKGDATAISTSLPGFGFQISAVRGNHTLAGTYTIPAALAGSIHSDACGATTVVEHSTRLAPDTVGINKYSIQFYWTAPAPFSDSVTFYSLLNAVNGDGGSSGDNPNAGHPVTIYEAASDQVTQLNSFGNSLSVYPNPATNWITISYKERITEVVITNFLGLTVYANNFDNTEVLVNLAGLPTGIYCVKVNDAEVRKFVKQ